MGAVNALDLTSQSTARTTISCGRFAARDCGVIRKEGIDAAASGTVGAGAAGSGRPICLERREAHARPSLLRPGAQCLLQTLKIIDALSLAVPEAKNAVGSLSAKGE